MHNVSRYIYKTTNFHSNLYRSHPPENYVPRVGRPIVYICSQISVQGKSLTRVILYGMRILDNKTTSNITGLILEQKLDSLPAT